MFCILRFIYLFNYFVKIVIDVFNVYIYHVWSLKKRRRKKLVDLHKTSASPPLTADFTPFNACLTASAGVLPAENATSLTN